MQLRSGSSAPLSFGGCLNYPLYLPGRTREVAALFLRGDQAGAVAALEKMATLGSQDAKTVLAEPGQSVAPIARDSMNLTL